MAVGKKEIEKKIIGINPKQTREALKKAGATYVGKFRMRMVLFSMRGDGSSEITLRLRTDGSKAYLTLKDWDLKKRKDPYEYETEVKDFKTAAIILVKLFGKPAYTEKTREIYRLGRSEIVIDKYADLPHYMEIEAPSEAEVAKAYGRIGKPGEVLGNFPTGRLYAHYGIDRKKHIKEIGWKLDKLLS
jgi:adenylate cyclase class 2